MPAPAAPCLNIRQQKFIDAYILCGNVSESARRAGYSEKTAAEIGYELLRKPQIAAAVAARQATYAAQLQITKEDVIGGIAGAIRLAREQQNPPAMIQGCVALAKLCGFFAPELHHVELSSNTAAFRARLVAMSDDELVALAQGAPAIG